MTLNEYNSCCESLEQSTRSEQWGAHVWKIGGKVYALGSLDGADDSDDGQVAVTFKCSEIAFETMKDAAGVRPAPYLASRGFTWLQRTHEDAISDADLKSYIADSYAIVAKGLTKKLQRELGLME